MNTHHSRWSSLLSLTAPDHRHLDRLVEQSLPPGSREWLPIMLDVVEYLLDKDGRWLVTLPVGTTFVPPRSSASIPDVFACVDVAEKAEPPAVYRMWDIPAAPTWEGERHEWQWVVRPGVVEHVRFQRPSDPPSDELWFRAHLDFEVAVVLPR